MLLHVYLSHTCNEIWMEPFVMTAVLSLLWSQWQAGGVALPLSLVKMLSSLVHHSSCVVRIQNTSLYTTEKRIEHRQVKRRDEGQRTVTWYSSGQHIDRARWMTDRSCWQCIRRRRKSMVSEFENKWSESHSSSCLLEIFNIYCISLACALRPPSNFFWDLCR